MGERNREREGVYQIGNEAGQRQSPGRRFAFHGSRNQGIPRARPTGDGAKTRLEGKEIGHEKSVVNKSAARRVGVPMERCSGRDD